MENEKQKAQLDLSEFNELTKKREEIEKEIEENLQFLENPENKGVGMHGKLIDPEGFPRNDIDIFAIRTARHKVICLKNDYAEINKQIENYLHKIHSSAPVIRVKRDTQKKTNGSLEEEEKNEKEVLKHAQKNTFAIIEHMVENSPAAKAGLQIGDCIYQFGDIQKKSEIEPNAVVLKNVADYVKKKPSTIEVKLLRCDKLHNYIVVPEIKDQGLFIGCHLVPLQAE